MKKATRSSLLLRNERGNYAHATSRMSGLITGINCVGGWYFLPYAPLFRPPTHSTLTNVHLMPAPPSLQPRKCKAIRYLAAKGFSPSNCIFWPPPKTLEVRTTRNQRAANCELGLPAFCRFWPRSLQVVVDADDGAGCPFPIKAMQRTRTKRT